MHQKLRVKNFHTFPRFTCVPKDSVQISSELLTFDISEKSLEKRQEVQKSDMERLREMPEFASYTFSAYISKMQRDA